MRRELLSLMAAAALATSDNPIWVLFSSLGIMSVGFTVLMILDPLIFGTDLDPVLIHGCLKAIAVNYGIAFLAKLLKRGA